MYLGSGMLLTQRNQRRPLGGDVALRRFIGFKAVASGGKTLKAQPSFCSALAEVRQAPQARRRPPRASHRGTKQPCSSPGARGSPGAAEVRAPRRGEALGARPRGRSTRCGRNELFGPGPRRDECEGRPRRRQRPRSRRGRRRRHAATLAPEAVADALASVAESCVRDRAAVWAVGVGAPGAARAT